jgi:hypothetical protein
MNVKSRIIPPTLSLEDTVSRISEQIGGFILYNFIQSMNRENFENILHLQYSEDKVKEIMRSEKERKNISDTWIRSTITSNIHRMRSKFKHVLGKYGYIPDLTTLQGVKKDRELGDYLIDEKAIKDLLIALQKVIPEEMYKFEKYRNELTNKEDIDFFQRRLDYIKGKNAKQKGCDHRFSDSLPEQRRIRECKKCGYKKIFR